MGVDSGIYKVVIVLHVLCAIVGFGTVFLNALYGQQAKARRGSEGLAIAQANYHVGEIATYFIYGVVVSGFLAVLASDDVFTFSQIWVGVSMLLYVVALGLSHGVLRPNLRRMQGLMGELVAAGPPPAGATGGPPPQVAEIEQRGKTVAATGATLNLLTVVILVLMVWKPGV